MRLKKFHGKRNQFDQMIQVVNLFLQIQNQIKNQIYMKFKRSIQTLNKSKNLFFKPNQYLELFTITLNKLFKGILFNCQKNQNIQNSGYLCIFYSLMNFAQEYRYYRLFSRMRQIKKTFILVYYLIQTVQFIFLTFLILLSMYTQMQQSGIFILKFFEIVMNTYLTTDNVKIFALTQIGLSVVSVLIFVIRLKLQPSYDQVDVYKGVDLALFYVLVAIRAIIQLTIYISVLGFVNAFKSNSPILFILQVLISIIVHTYYNYKIEVVSLYSYFTIPMVFFITAFNTPYSYVFLIVISIYLFFTTNEILKRIYYTIAVLLAIFVLKNLFLLKQIDGSDTQNPFFYIVPLSILLPLLLYKFNNKITLVNSLDFISASYQTLNSLKSEIPHSQLRPHQFYSLYSNINNLLISNKDEKSPQVQKILDKQHSKLTKHDFFLLLQAFLDRQCKKSAQNNLLIHIQRLKVRMRLSYSMQQTINEMRSLTQQFERSDKKNSYQFYQTFEQIIKKFAIFKNDAIYSAYIVYLNNYHENFENKTYQLMEKLSSFWKEVSQHQVIRTKLDKIFSEVLDLKDDLENSYQNIKKLQTFNSEKNAVNIIKTVINVYENQQKTVLSNSQKLDDPSKIIYSFIIIENDNIKFISKDFIKNLGQKSRLAYQNIDKRSIFGNDFAVIVDDMLKSINTKNQNEWRTVPIICKQGFVDLKKVRILWYPSLESQNRTIIKFKTEEDVSEQPFFIYHCRSDTIKYYNSHFIRYFKIDKQKFQDQITNCQFFFNQLFISTEFQSEEMKNYLKDGNVIRCKIYLKNYVQKGDPVSFPVQITIFKCIKVDNILTFCIMKIKKINQSKTTKIIKNQEREIINNKNNDKKDLRTVFTSNDNVWAKQYQHEQFFCKIPNNYESKITQKQAQLQEPGRFVYRYFIHIIFGLLVIAVMVLWIMDLHFLQNRIYSYRKEMISMQNTSQQYALLYQAYSLAIKRYYIQNYPQQTKLVKGSPAFVYLNIYEMAQQQSLDEFLNRYLTQINHPPNYHIQYNLEFTHFSIETDTSMSTLMDFAQHIKKDLAITDLNFLLRNYNRMRNLTIHYEDAFKYRIKVDQITASSQISFWILVASSILLIGAILYVLWKIQLAIDIVYSLIEMLSVNQLKDSIIIFNEKKNRIQDVFDPSIGQIKPKIMPTQNQRPLNSLSDTNSQNSKQEIPHSQHSLLIKDQISPRKQQPNIQHDTNQNQVTQGKALLDKFYYRQEESKQKIIDQSFMIKLSRKLFFIGILIVLNIVFYVDYDSINNEKRGILEFFDIKQKLYVSLLHIKRQEVDAPMKSTLIHYFKNNSMSIEQYNLSKLELVIQVSDQMYFKEITEFGQSARITLLSDMCKIAGKYTQGSLKPCQKYLKGIVTKGFGQTFDLFIQNARKVRQQSFEQFGIETCTQSSCPPYYQHEFVSILMGQTIRSVIFNLNKQTQRIFDVLIAGQKLTIVYKSFGMLIVLILYFICDRVLLKRCKMAINYFRIVPKEVMCSTKLTTFMRKRNLLSKFDIL